MANTIKLKRASGSDPGDSDLSTGELAIRTSNCKLFSKNDSGSAIGIVAGSADTLTTARTIAGVSFDGSANISLNNNAITNGAGYITATLTNEQVQDIVGGMVSGNTETGITVTYQDGDGTLDFVVGTLNQDTTGNAATATALETARNIGGVSFDGTGNINLPGVNTTGNQNTTGNAATATVATNVNVTDESSDTSCNVLFSTSATGTRAVKSGTNLTFNSSNGTLTATAFSGNGASLSSVDAATLDSLDSTSFLRADAADSGTGLLTLSGGLSLSGKVGAAITAASDGSTITLDLGANTHQSVTLGGNRTFAAPSNQTVGQSGSIFITQDGTGSRTASFNSAFKFVGGTAPTLSTAANAVDRIDYVIKSSNVIHCAVSLDVK